MVRFPYDDSAFHMGRIYPRILLVYVLLIILFQFERAFTMFSILFLWQIFGNHLASSLLTCVQLSLSVPFIESF